MAQRIQLNASPRHATASAVRQESSIPAILYGHGIAAQNVQVDYRTFLKTYKQAGQTSLVDLSVDGEDHPVLIREVQRHPVRDNILHIDFYQVRMDEEIEAEVPLTFIGESSAIKDMAGVLVRNLDHLEIRALPRDLPHEIQIDISSLTNFDAIIHVKDVAVPTGVTVLNEADEVVALVQEPRSEAEIEALSEAVVEDIEKVEGIKKEEPAAVPAEGEEGAPTPDEKAKA